MNLAPFFGLPNRDNSTPMKAVCASDRALLNAFFSSFVILQALQKPPSL